MGQNVGRAVPDRRKTVILSLIIGVVLIIVVASAIAFAPGVTAGAQLIREGNEEDVREAVKVLVDAYSNLVALISAAFGAVAFLVTFRQNQAGVLTARAWGILIIAFMLLVGALLSALIGREVLLAMVSHNAVNISLSSLSIARWLSYGCLALAAPFVAYSAAEGVGAANQ